MKAKNVLFKVSGDLVNNTRFQEFVIEKAKDNYVVVICGGGRQINKTLKKNGIKPYYNGNGARVTKSLKERDLQREVLWKVRDKLINVFIGKGVWVVSPFIEVAAVECPINGDDMVIACYLGFDEVYVFTLNDRIMKKNQLFRKFKKIKVIGV